LARKRTEFGTLYKGNPEGQWAWIAHRVTGVAIILFLFAHIVDTAVIGWGPEAYNRVVAVYQMGRGNGQNVYSYVVRALLEMQNRGQLSAGFSLIPYLQPRYPIKAADVHNSGWIT